MSGITGIIHIADLSKDGSSLLSSSVSKLTILARFRLGVGMGLVTRRPMTVFGRNLPATAQVELLGSERELMLLEELEELGETSSRAA